MSESCSAKIPTFNGKKGDDWVIYWERLLAFATLKKYRYILEPTAKKELPKDEKVLSDENNSIKKAMAGAQKM